MRPHPRLEGASIASPSEMEILQQACVALSSANRRPEAAAWTIRWVRAVLGREDSSVLLLLPDSAGRLRLARREGRFSRGGRARSAAERVAFETQVALHVRLRQPPGSELAILPLAFGGRSIGILEIEGPSEKMASRRGTLEAVVGLAANLLANSPSPGDDDDPEEGQVEPRLRDLELGIAWAAHELRGPLLTARAGLDGAIKTRSGRALRELLRQSSDELGQLAASIERLLSWGAGMAALDLTLADLTREVEAAVEDRAAEIDPAQLRIKAPARVIVRVDREQIRRAIANVVENATKHAPPGSLIRISVDQVGGIATVRVVNRGPAIRPADREVIFEPFVRGRSPSHPGSGLGLFIAHRIVEAHRGVIRVRSSAGWTTFFIELPAELSAGRNRGARTREVEAPFGS